MTTEKDPHLQRNRDLAQSFADEEQVAYALVRLADGYISIVQESRERLPTDELLEVIRPTYRYIDDVRKRNGKLGRNWFSPETMRFFSSRVQERIYPTPDGRAYFVTSERGPDNVRKYSVRVALPDGSIDTVGEFQAYRTGRAAHNVARKLAEEVQP